MTKRKLIVSYAKISEEIKQLIEETYPDGLEGNVFKIKDHKNDSWDVVKVETEDSIYLVKVELPKKKVKPARPEDDDDLFPGPDADDDADDTGEEGDQDEFGKNMNDIGDDNL